MDVSAQEYLFAPVVMELAVCALLLKIFCPALECCLDLLLLLRLLATAVILRALLGAAARRRDVVLIVLVVVARDYVLDARQAD